MNPSGKAQNSLVLTRKLTPSDKQRRKELIAEAAKSTKQNNKRSPYQQNHTRYRNHKTFGCFGGEDDNYTNVKNKSDITDNSTKSSTSIPSVDLLDTGNDSGILRVYLSLSFYI